MIHYDNNHFIHRHKQGEPVSWGQINPILPDTEVCAVVESIEPQKVTKSSPLYESQKCIVDAHSITDVRGIRDIFNALQVGGVAIHTLPLVGHFPDNDTLEVSEQFFKVLADKCKLYELELRTDQAFHNTETGQEVYFAYKKMPESKFVSIRDLLNIYSNNCGQ